MITIQPGKLDLVTLREVYRSERVEFELDPSAYRQIDAGSRTVHAIAEGGQPAYGINTGFGRLAQTHIPKDQLELLQKNLVLSHAVGVGRPLDTGVVRLVMLLKVASLARGSSGVRREVVDALIRLVNADVIPYIPEKGSVGASGDLAPLAHMSSALLGMGEVFLGGERMSSSDALARIGMEPLVLRAKEGLALLNGTQVSTAIALGGIFRLYDLLRTAIVSGALSVDAAAGSTVPFDPRIQLLRGHRGQIEAGRALRELLVGSEINSSHQDCEKVQDPYSLRCQPQVLGACLDQMHYAASVLLIEANAVSDNPLVFPETNEVLSGGNFHAEPVAFAADALAVAGAEVGSLSERRIALLMDATLSGLPPFLVRDGGVNSGFMIAHVTAASLASENKTYAHPASVDSLPTSANQEDHVSMATFAARKLHDIADNVAAILSIELLAATQGVELRAPFSTSPSLLLVVEKIRSLVAHYDIDHYLSPDIQVITDLVNSGSLAEFCPLEVLR